MSFSKLAPVFWMLAGAAITLGVVSATKANAAAPNHVFELRMYHVAPGKFEALQTRFRDHVLAAFARHNMKPVIFGLPQDAPDAGNLLIYVLEHPSRADADKDWLAFNNDPVWMKAKAESEVNGKLVEKVDHYFMDPTDFSPIK
jgi:hypothetical protein